MVDIPSYEQLAPLLDPGQKAGQLFMPAAFINDSEEAVADLETLIRTSGVGGLCFFHSRASAATNFEGPKKVVHNEQSLETLKQLILRYQKASRFPLLIAIDAEWGLAMRIENTPQFPYALTLGALKNKEALIYETGRHIGYDCRQAGIHWNFAPVADINLNPRNPVIGYRSFGEEKQAVAEKALAFMKGLQSQGILTAAKHFPGHGDTATDSHLGLPLINKSREALLNNELYPFRKLIEEGVDAIMAGHLAVPALSGDKQLPASVSGAILQGLLREEMGFNGVIVSDALNMHSVSMRYPEKGLLEWEAFNAGNDVLCFSEHVAEGIERIAQLASPAQLEAAFRRVWDMKYRAFANTRLPLEKPRDQELLNQQLAGASLTLHKGTETGIERFRQADFLLLEIALKPGQLFTEGLRKQPCCKGVWQQPPGGASMDIKPQATRQLLIALYPPSVKPPNNFGLSEAVIGQVNRLLQTSEVVLYLFGNPYVLDLLDFPRAHAVVIAYQDFPSFQENAIRQFLGKTRAPGSLPVTLKTDAS